MFSALAAVCTVDCTIEIVLITLHYITKGEPFVYFCRWVSAKALAHNTSGQNHLIQGASGKTSFTCKTASADFVHG